MHIRQLARSAALITVAAIVTAGFSAGIAQATSAAPASTISAASAPVTPGGTALRPHMSDCPKYTFCAYTGARFVILAQYFTCAESIHNAFSDTIYLMVNNCTAHAVYSYDKYDAGYNCVSASSSKGRYPNGFPAIDYYYVAPYKNC